MQTSGEEETVKRAQAVKTSSLDQSNHREKFPSVIELEVKNRLSRTDYCYMENNNRL